MDTTYLDLTQVLARLLILGIRHFQFAQKVFCGLVLINLHITIEFFTIGRISVRLSDRSKVTQNKINFVKNCPQWGFNSQPPDHQSHALPTVLSHYLVVDVTHQYALLILKINKVQHVTKSNM